MTLKKVFNYSQIFDVFTYPAGEPHVRLNEASLQDLKKVPNSLGPEAPRPIGPLPEFRPFIISPAFNWNDLVTIRIGDKILKDNEIKATFVVPYMPFSRHDRKNDALDSMPLSLVKEILSPVHVITIDPHSDVTSEKFPHYPQSEVVKLFEAKGIFDLNAMVAIPDAGASKKVYTWLNGRDVVQCLKTRDPKTGHLSGFQVVNPDLVKDRNVVIIDDICDGGGTFIGLADKLLEAGARSLKLGVTHGLFTKGIDSLYTRFTTIYTLDTCTIAYWGEDFTVSTEKLIMEGSYF